MYVSHKKCQATQIYTARLSQKLKNIAKLPRRSREDWLETFYLLIFMGKFHTGMEISLYFPFWNGAFSV